MTGHQIPMMHSVCVRTRKIMLPNNKPILRTYRFDIQNET